MKHTTKRAAALLLLLSLVLSLFTVSVSAAGTNATTPTGYTKASDVKYKEVGGHLANWGARGEDCKFLTTYAGEYYTGNAHFDKLNAPNGGTSQSDAPKSELYHTLQDMMKGKHKHQTSYGETKDLYKYTDCVHNDTAHISSFYSGKELNGNWGNGWNREHTWPNSKGLNGNDENDIMMLRPTATSENSSRGNTAYGAGSSYYDPNEESNGSYNLHGDCARIVLYVYVRWGNTSYMWGSKGVMENLDVLLQWMEEDPVDTWEMGRNDAVQDITGVRNVFIDFPEFAWKLFGREIPKDMTTPSGYAKDGTITVPDGKPTPPTPDVPDVPEVDYNKPGTPATNLPENGEYVIWAPAFNMAMSSVWADGSHWNSGKGVSVADGKLTGYGDTEKWTIQNNGDGTISILCGGKKLGMQDQFSSMKLGAPHDKWILEDAGNGMYYVKNSVRGAYIEWFAAKETWSGYNKIDAGKEPLFALTFTSTKDSNVPVDPEPTNPDVKPTEPDVKPTEPDVKPTEPDVKPTEPEVKPTEPEVKPTIPQKTVLSMKIPGKTVYFNGKIVNGRFLGTTTSMADAVEVMKEETDGGFYLHVKGGKYISVQETEYKDKKTGEMKKGIQIALTDKAETVFTLDSKLGIMKTTVGGTEYYLGSYTNKDGKTFDTISASKASYVKSDNIGKTQFAAKLTTVGGAAQTGDNFSMVTVVTVMVSVSALAVLVINRKKYNA